MQWCHGLLPPVDIEQIWCLSPSFGLDRMPHRGRWKLACASGNFGHSRLCDWSALSEARVEHVVSLDAPPQKQRTGDVPLANSLSASNLETERVALPGEDEKSV